MTVIKVMSRIVLKIYFFTGDSIDGWVPPSKKLKIDESIKCGSDTGVSLAESRNFH